MVALQFVTAASNRLPRVRLYHVYLRRTDTRGEQRAAESKHDTLKTAPEGRMRRIDTLAQPGIGMSGRGEGSM